MDTSSARYRAEQRVGTASGVETWTGTDLTLGRPVTVRVVAGEGVQAPRLKSQLRSLARLEHPGLLHVLDTCTVKDGFAIITEALPDHRVADEVNQQGRLSIERTLDVTRQIGSALGALHATGFAHGGISTENLGIRHDGTVVILDGPPTTDATTIPATPSGDVRALALWTHQALVGGAPRESPAGAPELHPEIPAELHDALERAIAPESHDHWPDIGAFIAALGEDPIKTESRHLHPHRSFLHAERVWLIPVAAVFAVALVAAAVGVLWPRDGEQDSTTPNTDTVVDESEIDVPVASQPQVSVNLAPSPAGQLTLVDIIDFDPSGDDRAEHPERLILINDGDPSQGWQTERYTTPQFGNLKPGVGLIIQIGPPQLIDRVTIRSPSIGWTAEIYASTSTPASIEDWNEPIGAVSNVRGDATIETGGVEAATLLVWFIDLGDEVATGGHRLTVTGLNVWGRPLFG